MSKRHEGVLSVGGVAVVAAAALQCGGILPVGEVNKNTDGIAASGSSGATGGSGATGSGATGSGATGSGGGTPEGDGGLACWENQLPPEVQPILPTATVTASCAAAPTNTQWNASIADAGAAIDADARAAFVGRWLACSSVSDTTFSAVPHAGIEFGGNGRWRLLFADSSGAIVPSTSTAGDEEGLYSVDGDGELWLGGNLGSAWQSVDVLKLSLDTNYMLVTSQAADGATSFYARTAPAANNGDDNLPSTTDGTCTLVGTWDLVTTGDAGIVPVPGATSPVDSPPATFSFDAIGNFVGGVPGTDLCTSHTMWGTYSLTPGSFEITENYGMGVCSWAADASYSTTFNATCTQVALQPNYDNCTGGRGYFNGPTMLTKRL